MRRRSLPSEQIEDIRWAYKTLYRRKLPPSAALETLRERADRPMVAEYITFIETSKRGLCRGYFQPKRK
jgi:acyl-[acyl carrier protein]--UDP-N-acetylglucosamine O-acyltransferase